MSHHLYNQSLLCTIKIEPIMNLPWANNCNKDIKNESITNLHMYQLWINKFNVWWVWLKFQNHQNKIILFVNCICYQTKNGFWINNKVNYYSAIFTTWLKTCLNMLHWELLMTIDHGWILTICLCLGSLRSNI
jgi:hypothetical protein